jgi:hypothetical protein
MYAVERTGQIMNVVRHVFACVCLVAILAACSDGGGSAGPSTTASGGTTELRTELDARGQTVESIGSGSSPLSVDPEWWCVSGVVVGVYEYPDEDQASRDVQRLQGPAFFAASDFAAQPHFYARDQLIVQAFGAHDSLAPVLVELLGPELAIAAFGFAPTLACRDFRI